MISDGDGPYFPGVSDCTWIIAPTGASTLYLTLSSLVLGGAGGDEDDQLEISVCEDINCLSPINIPGSPFSQSSSRIK